ncbi:MAG: glycosyltransferase family 39 protein [Herminiimonas sp.]|nr:glycosyltransferase family 39 protein [Herminiimonas sp.]MDB5852988.1 glycosyltransferase family 39 protein [Herminiimonas sp.]
MNLAREPEAPSITGTATGPRANIPYRYGELTALFAVLLFASLLRTWNLEQNGWGAEYYSAAVRSMAMNWQNFFYDAFDPAGFISVDKPPGALWMQVASVKLFGFTPLSLLMPQVVEGVAAVAVLFHLVRRQFGAMAALLASLFFAVTPVWVAVNRTNNTDSLLLLVLLMATWPLLKAAEVGSRRLLLLSMLLIGVAFNVKMLAATIVLPGFFLVYFVGAPHGLQRRFADLGLAAVVVVACSLPWVIAVDSTPAKDRPYVGSSKHNSMLELVVGHNAMSRFFAATRSRVSSSANTPGAIPLIDAQPGAERTNDAAAEVRHLFARLFVTTPTGPLRLAGGQLAAQFAWLLPFAAAGLGFTVFWTRSSPPVKRLTPQNLQLLLWLCWSVTYIGVYSYLGGIIHYYYLSTLAPPFAALAGIGLAGLWQQYRQHRRFAVVLPLLLIATAVWQLYIHSGALGPAFQSVRLDAPGWQGALVIAMVVGVVIGFVGLVVLHVAQAAGGISSSRTHATLSAGALTAGLTGLLVLPLAWAASTILLPAHGVMPSADVYRLISASRDYKVYSRARLGQSADLSALIRFLRANHAGERYLLATSTTQFAAPIIIATGEAVMARGGFHGLDPATTPASLDHLVNTGQLRFVLLGDVATVSRRLGADAMGKPVADWIRANGKLVKPELWRSAAMRGNAELFDMRPIASLRY